MEFKKLCPDKSEEIIVVTLQVLWANSAYKDTTERKKIIREEAYLYRFDVPIEWQKDGVTERFFLRLLVTGEDLRNLGVKDANATTILREHIKSIARANDVFN